MQRNLMQKPYWFRNIQALSAIYLAIALTGLAQAAPRAKPRKVTLILPSSELSGTTGEKLTLRGSVRNGLQQRVWLSGSQVQLRGRALSVEREGLLQTAPLSLNPGRTTKVLPLTQMTVRLDADPGTYHGVVYLLGGKRRGDQDVLAQVSFQVKVR